MSASPDPRKFTFGLWTVGNRGRDPFGEFVGRALDPCDAVKPSRSLGYGVNIPRQRSRSIDAPPRS
jgi:xylose isomerase